METSVSTRPSVGSAVQTDEKMKESFIAICTEANELQLADNVKFTFQAAEIVLRLKGLLTQSVVEHYFVPLMGTRVGFLTDRDKTGPKYSWETVRDCVIDAACAGLAPVKNQFNIIAGNMYPTKEGFSHLLKKIGVRYYITTSGDKSAPASPVAEIECKVMYEVSGSEKKNFTYMAYPKKNSTSSLDQLKGKAERKCKKALYELVTGIDLGDADEDSSSPDDQPQPSTEDRKAALRDKISNGSTEQPRLL